MSEPLSVQLTTEESEDLASHLHADLCHHYDLVARAYDTPKLTDGRKRLIFEHICRFILWNRRRLGSCQYRFYRTVGDGNFPSQLAAMLFEQPSKPPEALSRSVDAAQIRHLHIMYLDTVGNLKQQAITGEPSGPGGIRTL